MGDVAGHSGHQALHRFFVAPEAIAGTRVSFSEQQLHQMRRVLRLSDGALVLVCDGSGTEHEVCLELGETPGGRIRSTKQGMAEPACRVHLLQSALRGDQFAWLLQKGTEIGVSAFTPVLFSRTQPADYDHRLARYRTIVREAAEQCERCYLPPVMAPLPFDHALRDAQGVDGALRILLDERETGTALRQAIPRGARSVAILVGPEGGLTMGERTAAVASGVTPVSLGTRILRSETAGIVAATLVLAATGDIG